MEEKPNYYAIIPANVRYDNNLSASEKLLYGEITALTQKSGECWATNNYFSSLYNVTTRSITSWLNNLEKNNYIKMVIIMKPNSKEIEKRIIKIPTEINFYTYGKNFLGGIEKNFQENNININNINKKEIYKEKDKIETIINEELTLNEKLRLKVIDWVKYKSERHQSYKEQGIKTLIRQLDKASKEYGTDNVLELIDTCMANNWSGIILEKLKNNKSNVKKSTQDEWEKYCEEQGYR